MRRLLEAEHLLNYRYSGPVTSVVTRLMLFPPAQRGAQRVSRTWLKVAPLPQESPFERDRYRNLIRELRHPAIQQNLTLVIRLTVETRTQIGADGQVVPTGLPIDDDPHGSQDWDFLTETWLTSLSAALAYAADDFASVLPHKDDDALAFALGMNRRVFHAMRYQPGATNVSTTAAEAWEGAHGVCQDFAHILLVLLRRSGIPARYVSGFLPGEGAMHAWVEALLRVRGQPPAWYGLDPTHDRATDGRYITVAVGRDYRDIAPTSGTYFGTGGSLLTHHSRVVATDL